MIYSIKDNFKKDIKNFKKNWIIFKKDGKECFKEFLNKDTRYKQIPNAFTASRLLAPVFIIPAALSGNLILTGLFAGGFAFTDACDGFFARKYNVMSEFGRELDPITDKLFAGSLLIPLAIINPIMFANLLLEAIIAGINTHSRLSDNKPRTTILGKVKTGALSITMIVSYINLALRINPNIISLLIGLTGGLQIATAMKYYSNYKIAETEKKNKKLIESKKKSKILEEESNNDKKKSLDKKIEKENQIIATNEEKINKLNDLKHELIYEEKLVESNKVLKYKNTDY